LTFSPESPCVDKEVGCKYRREKTWFKEQQSCGCEAVDTRVRTGLILARRPKLTASWKSEGKGVCWFFVDILIVLLVLGAVDLNPGPQSEREKLDQILVYMRCQESDSPTQFDTSL